jgi:hypothetical protein
VRADGAVDDKAVSGEVAHDGIKGDGIAAGGVVVGFVIMTDFGGAAEDAELFAQLVYDGRGAVGEAFEADEFLDSGEVYLMGAEAVMKFFKGGQFEVP